MNNLCIIFVEEFGFNFESKRLRNYVVSKMIFAFKIKFSYQLQTINKLPNFTKKKTSK